MVATLDGACHPVDVFAELVDGCANKSPIAERAAPENLPFFSTIRGI